ncbi:MAG: hypothetical protein NT027_12885, partial [Proteobacteria bacterium]|nr:hypothetical protein [Pseudomonadota bacterium]
MLILRKTFLPLVTALASVISSNAIAETREVVVIEDHLTAKYSESVSVTLQLKDWLIGRVSWSIIGDLPPGFNLRPIGDDKVEISGQVNFEGKWCASAKASVSNQPTGFGTFCFTGEQNSQLQYPRLASSKIMLSFYGNKYTHDIIPIDPASITNSQGVKKLSVQKVKGNLPYGINTHVQLDNDRILFEGRVVGNYDTDTIIFKLVGESEQYPLYLNLHNYVSDLTECPDGQEYDYLSRICRVKKDPECPVGYYYSSTSKQCTLISGPCPPRFYFD